MGYFDWMLDKFRGDNKAATPVSEVEKPAPKLEKAASDEYINKEREQQAEAADLKRIRLLAGKYKLGTPEFESTVRLDQTDDILADIREHKPVLLRSTQRLGASSMLKSIEYKYGADKAVSVSAMGEKSIEGVERRIALGIAENLAQLLPNIDQEKIENSSLKELDALLGKQNQRMLITFDEAIAFIGDDEGAAFLKSLGELKNLDVVMQMHFSGRRAESIHKNLADFTEHAVRPLTREEVRRLVTQPLQGTVQFSQEAFDAIYALTGGRPYETQMLCSQLLEKKPKTHYTDTDINNIYRDVLKDKVVDITFHSLYSEALDPGGKEVVSRLALGENVQRGEIDEATITTLTAMGLVEEHNGSIQLTSRMFKEFVAKAVHLERIKTAV